MTGMKPVAGLCFSTRDNSSQMIRGNNSPEIDLFFVVLSEGDFKMETVTNLF